MQSHSCFRAVPDRTARARGPRRLKQNKQNPQTLRMPTQTKTASQGQRKAKYPLPEWGLLLMPLQLGLSSPPPFFSVSPTPPHICPWLTLPHTRRVEGQGGAGPDLWPRSPVLPRVSADQFSHQLRESKFCLKAHKSVPSHSLRGHVNVPCILQEGPSVTAVASARDSHPQRTRKTCFQDSLLRMPCGP